MSAMVSFIGSAAVSGRGNNTLAETIPAASPLPRAQSRNALCAS